MHIRDKAVKIKKQYTRLVFMCFESSCTVARFSVYKIITLLQTELFCDTRIQFKNRKKVKEGFSLHLVATLSINQYPAGWQSVYLEQGRLD